MQYVVAIVPLVLAFDVRRGTLYRLVAGAFIAIAYFQYLDGSRPLYSEFTGRLPHAAAALGLLTWLYLIVLVIEIRRLRASPAVSSGEIVAR